MYYKIYDKKSFKNNEMRSSYDRKLNDVMYKIYKINDIVSENDT